MSAAVNKLGWTEGNFLVNSFKRIFHVLMHSFYQLQTLLQSTIDSVTAFISSVITFVLGIFEAVCNAYNKVAMLIAFMVDCFHGVLYYDYKGFVMWLSILPQTYYGECTAKAKKIVWDPFFFGVSNTTRQISRYFRAQVREYAVYVRGFGELCRRLFLFASDVTPGGRMTVSAFLVILAVLCCLKLFTFLRLFLQLLELAYGIFSFLLHPLVLTIKDILALFDPILQVVYLLFRAILYASVSALQVIGNFVWLNLVSIMSGLYRCWQIFINSKVMKIICSLLAKITLIFLEKFIFVIIPFTTKITFAFLDFAFDLSCVAYENFFTVRIRVEKLDPFNPNGIGIYVLTFWALLLAFRFRKRFPETFCSEIDGSRPPVTSDTAASGYRTHATKTSSLRGKGFSSQTTTTYDGARSTTKRDEGSNLRYRGKTKEVNEGGNVDDPTEGHIHYSSSAHICTAFIEGKCQKGKKCDTHHCALPYQWQYRLSLEGWISFVAEDNVRIEGMYCNPENDVLTTSDVNVALKSYRTHMSHSNESVRLDFENMRLEKSYHRADIRRLSTESYAKERENRLATPWVWYTKSESGDWVNYGDEGAPENVSQEDIESAFLRREANFNYTKNGQEFRVHFLMTPMCERSFRPYAKRLVRRRPLYRSVEELGEKAKTEVASLFSVRRLFSWL